MPLGVMVNDISFYVGVKFHPIPLLDVLIKQYFIDCPPLFRFYPKDDDRILLCVSPSNV